MFSDRQRDWLRDIAVNVDVVFGYVGDVELAAFVADRRTVDACERCLQRITEAVIRLGPDAMRLVDADLPFRAIRNLGNRLRHQYEDIDPALLLNTIRTNLPPLRAACLSALER